MIEVGNIIISELQQVSVIDMTIDACASEHAKCVIKARTSKSEEIDKAASQIEKVTVLENQNNKIIFMGIPMSIELTGSEVMIELISESFLCDIKKENCTYQDIEATFAQVIEDVARKDGFSVDVGESLEYGIGQVLYRYEETAWQLLKRIAGMTMQPIVPKYTMPAYSVSVGFTEGAKTFSEKILELHEILETGSECLGVKCYSSLAVGDKVLYNEYEYAVKEVHAYTDKGILLFEYIFVYADTLMAEYEKNSALCGLILFGTVNKAEENNVFVDFDIDKGNGTTAAYSYPWKTIAGNMLYCMPEQDAKVAINLYDATGTSASAITCMRTEEPEFSREEKTFETSSGKKMNLGKDMLSLTNPVEEKTLQMDFGEGISISSFSDIEFENVLEDIAVSGVTVEQYASNEITIKMGCDILGMPEAELAIRATVEIDGDNVVIKAVERTSYNQIADAPTELKLNGAKLFWKVLAMVAVVAVACVVAVALAPATMATAAVVGGVIKACAIGGAAFMGATMICQGVNDYKNGTMHSVGEYLYQAVDSFCTGAIMTAPMVVFPQATGATVLDKWIVFGKKMGGSALASLYYQGIDALLDAKFGSDFYDVDGSVGLNLIFDVVGNGFGEGLELILGKALTAAAQYYKQHFKQYLNVSGRAAARRYLEETISVDAKSSVVAFCEYIAEQKEIFAKQFGKIEAGTMFNANVGNNYFWGIFDKNPEVYEEMEYFYFDSDGELGWR